VKEVSRSGHIIIKEGKPSNLVIIVKEGAVEVSKSNLSHIYINKISGIIKNNISESYAL